MMRAPSPNSDLVSDMAGALRMSHANLTDDNDCILKLMACRFTAREIAPHLGQAMTTALALTMVEVERRAMQ